MADSPRGVDHVDSMDSNDSSPKQPDKKKSRRPASELDSGHEERTLRLMDFTTNRYCVPATAIKGLAVRLLDWRHPPYPPIMLTHLVPGLSSPLRRCCPCSLPLALSLRLSVAFSTGRALKYVSSSHVHP
jgi:hypothetical protein